MTREQVYVFLADILRDVLEDESVAIGDATDPANLKGWDSLAQISVLAAVEVRFGIEIRAAEGECLRTLGDLVDLILGKAPPVAVT